MNDTSPPASIRASSAIASALWWGLLTLGLVLVLAWGALHGWIVPRIGELRPALETQATRALGVPVGIGAISARSEGLVPTFELHDVVLRDAQGREALRLGRVVVSLSPRSLWNLGFEQLFIERPQLQVRRSADGRLWVAGLDVTEGGDGGGRAADWFFRQKEVVVQGGTLHWIDEARAAPPLALTDLQFVARNGARRHALRLDATPPAEWGRRFSLRGLFRQPLLSRHPGRWQDWTGQLYADFEAVDLARLRPYTGLGVQVFGGRGALRAWADVEAGRIAGGVADVALRQVNVRLAPGREPLALASVAGRLAGRWGPAGFEAETRGLQFDTADGRRWPGGNATVSWTAPQGSTPGQGRLEADRLDLAALGGIARHLPLDPGTHELLARHAPRGLVEQLQAQWRGAPAQMQSYAARGRVSGLAIAAQPDAQGGVGLPGVRGATVEFDVSDAGGTARLQVQRGAVELPGVLEAAVVPLERLAAELQWQLRGEHIRVDATGLSFANPDVQGEGRVAWETGQGPRGRFPGVLDLQLQLARANGARVWRYLPLDVPKDTRDYVREAVSAGLATDGRIRVKGDLHDFPFTNPRSGEFRISTKVRNVTYAFVPRTLQPGPAQWAPLTELSGELVFERNSMQVLGARGRFAGAPGLQVQADASIPDLDAPTVMVNGLVRGPLAESLAIFNASPVADSIDKALAQTTATGPAELRLRLALPLAQLDRSRVQGSVTLAGNDVQVVPEAPLLAGARGVVSFTEQGFSLAGVQARALGGELRIEGGSRALPAGSTEAPMQLRLQGTASAQGLRQAGELGAVARLARRASGAAAYTATLGLRPTGVDLQVASSLQGLALDLPPPLNKAAEASLPLRVDIARVMEAERPTDQVSVELGRVASVHYVRDISRSEPQVLRGAIGVGLAPGESAPLPPRGVLANINFATIDVDAWESVLSGILGTVPAARSSPGGQAALAPSTMAYLPTVMAVRARVLRAEGHTLDNVVIGGSREGLTWRANLDADQLNGYVEYRQPSGSGAGWVMARLARLSLAASAAGSVETLLEEQPTTIPALDVVVDDFELRGRRLGRLDIEAVNRGASTNGGTAEWRLNRLALTVPEASFSATGNWAVVPGPAPARGAAERRRTNMTFRLEVSDAGALLGRLGMKDVVRRGRGRLEGQVAWIGSPLSLDYPSMNGAMGVNVESGQFLKADPGLAKLLGVLSLQALPRRLALDFRDVFSEGFAFDFVRGDITVRQGVLATNNLQMKGVNAAVLMEGKADIARETQDLKVVVVPEINAGTASLVAGVINPAVGLGTFLAQLFLREPLTRAATQEFHIDGTWTDPRITRVRRSDNPAAAPARPAPRAQTGN